MEELKLNKHVYIDTTIISYLFDERKEIQNFIDITKDWWKTQRSNYQIYLSTETIAELNQGNYPNKKNAIEMAKTIEILPKIDEILEIAKIYIKNFVMPAGFEGDAIHLA